MHAHEDFVANDRQPARRDLHSPDEETSRNAGFMITYARAAARMQTLWGAMIPGATSAGIRSQLIALTDANRRMDQYPGLAHLFNSLTMARAIHDTIPRSAPPKDVMKYNHGLYTHNADGSLNHVRSADILPYFEPGDEANWPQLFLTSNHARTDVSADISRIMDNFCSPLQKALGDKFALLRHPDELQSGRGKTIMLAAVDTQPSYEANAAAMLYRFNFRKDNTELDKRINPERDPRVIESYDAPAGWLTPSRAAVRLSKLMLKLMVKNPSSVDLDDPRTLEELTEAGELQPPLPLRDDAAAIARHITLGGYSMAGNTVNDAVRYLAHELRWNYQAAGLTAAAATAHVSRIIEHLGLICVAAPAVPVTQEEHDLGIRRLLINSPEDLISYHFLIGAWGDRAALVDGPREKICLLQDIQKHPDDPLGHSPDFQLGRGDKPGAIAEDANAMAHIADVILPKYEARQTPVTQIHAITAAPPCRSAALPDPAASR